MKVLSKCTLTKLKEYSQSYGAKEILNVPFIKEFDKEIWLLNECGDCIRTLRIGTKLLISYAGETITERQLKMRANKSIALRSVNTANRLAIEIKENEARNLVVKNQLKLWEDFILNNPLSKQKYIVKVNTMPSSKWRNYLRMKAAKHVNNESFEGLEISAPELKAVLFN